MADYEAGQHLLKSWPDVCFVVLFAWSVTHLLPVFASQESGGTGKVSGLNINKCGIIHFSIM
jgi:hypothetical protein